MFYDGVMIGLVADNLLYSKADAKSAGESKILELAPFKYPKRDKLVGISYFQASEGVLESLAKRRGSPELGYFAALGCKKTLISPGYDNSCLERY